VAFESVWLVVGADARVKDSQRLKRRAIKPMTTVTVTSMRAFLKDVHPRVNRASLLLADRLMDKPSRNPRRTLVLSGTMMATLF
tara:strand:+ start:1408 stop:1659 length:252 start_codon:yes stop_codon:yes gene_type:complete